MQLAKQVYNITTAENGLVFFKNGEPDYLSKHFDSLADGSKIHQEDFAVLMGRSSEINGAIYKNEGSCEEVAECIKNTFPLMW
jgi:serine/threonine-protein kinase HipA